MKLLLPFTVLFCLIFTSSWAQSDGFERLYEHVERNQFGVSIAETPDEGFLLFSTSNLISSPARFPTHNVSRVDKKGTILWSRDYYQDGLNSNINGSLLLLKDQEFIIGSGYSSFGEFNKYIMRANQLGDPIWVYQYGKSLDVPAGSSAFSRSKLAMLTDSTFVLFAESPDDQDFDIDNIYVSIIDTAGNQVNGQVIGENFPTTLTAMDVVPTLDNGFIACGDILNGAFDVESYLMKFDSVGNIEWNRKFTNPITDGGLRTVSVTQPTDSTYMMAGQLSFGGLPSDQYPYIAYLDSIGQVLWCGIVDYSGGSPDALAGLFNHVESNGNGVATATGQGRNGTANPSSLSFAVNVNTNGTLNWSQAYRDWSGLAFLNNGTTLKQNGGFAFYKVGGENDRTSYLISADANGETLCSTDFVDTLSFVNLLSDTLLLESTPFLNRDTLALQDSTYNSFQVPLTSLGTPGFYCEGDPIFEVFDATPSNVQDLSLVTYEWSTGETTASITVTDEEQYTVEVTINEDYCFTLCDTIQVSTQGPPTAGIDVNASIFCLEGEAFFTATGGGDYLWSTGETTETITVTDTETYEVTVTDVCGSSTTSAAFVIPEIRADLIVNSATFCQDSIVTIILDTNAPGGDIDWSTGDEDVLFVNVLAEGPYDVSVSTPFCGGATASAEVVFPTEPMDLVVSLDTSAFCRDSVFNISASATNADQFIWVDDVIGDFRPDVDPGTYTVVASNECGDSDPATITVGPFLCPLEGDCLAIPNIFTPNEDGRNDAFGAFIQPACEPLLQTYHLRIYSRWGQLIFESFENGARWDGTKDGSHQPADVYNYILTYSFLNGQAVAEEAARGEVVLVR